MKPIVRQHLSPSRLAVCLATALGLQASAPDAAPNLARLVHRGATHAFTAGARAAKAITSPSGSFLVTNCNDSGPGSLRDIASRVGDHGLIDLTALPCSTITLSSGAVNFLVDSVALTGPGPDHLTIVGNGSDRVIGHGGAGEIVLNGLTLTNGVITNSGGGCLYSSGSVLLYDSVVDSCRTQSNGTYTVLGGGVYARGNLSVTNSRISNNVVTAPTGHAYGGGAFVRGNLDLLESTVRDNVATPPSGNTGGIAADGDVSIAYSTVSGNQAQFNAGLALFAFYATSPLFIGSSTISGNRATGILGGIGVLADTNVYSTTIVDNYDAGGGTATGGFFLGTGVQVRLESTIVANNFTGSTRNDINGYSGAALTGANDIVMASTLALPAGTLIADPMLGPLADNGGPRKTHALLPGSPAIDSGNNACGCSEDERGGGFSHEVGAGPDIGAYELQSTGVTRHVTNCNDTGAGSLRDTIAAAVSGDEIDLSSLSCSTITLTSGALQVIQGNLSLQGPRASQLTIDGNGNDRILYHSLPGTLTVAGMTLTNGYFIADGYAGGGCLVDKDRLVLDAVTFDACGVVSRSASTFGGAVYAVALDMRGSTISRSQATALAGASRGGGLYVADLSMQDSTISDNGAFAGANRASYGGGLFANGRAQILRSTISGNQASEGGGAYFSYVSRFLDSTVSGNSAFAFGGGIVAEGLLALYNSTAALNTVYGTDEQPAGIEIDGALRLESTIVFGNSAGTGAYDIGARGDSSCIGSHNLIGVSPITLPPDTLHADPLLGPLQNNGGPTLTHALGAGSPAIDAGDNLPSLDTDQRGANFPRVSGIAADIGAFEVETGDTIFFDGFDGISRAQP